MSSIAISSRHCSDGGDGGDGDNAGFLDNFVDVTALHCASRLHDARLQNKQQQSTVPLLFLVFWPALTIPPSASCVNSLCRHYGYLETTFPIVIYFC
jgi:hypothetical protein